MKKMKWMKVIFAMLVIAALSLGACNTNDTESTATVAFSLTDAPDTSGLTNVVIAVSQIKVNESADAADGTGGSWKVLNLSTPKEFDLLALANGVKAAVGELEISGGTRINQIRFAVDSAKVSADNGTTYTSLTVPSDSVKIVNSFAVPLSGSIGITLDFDVRKSIVKTGAGVYRLKPAIRSIIEGEAGTVSGTAPAGAFVYLYKNGAYVEGTEPVVSDSATDTPAFPNAYTSAIADASTGAFKFSFIDPDTYDIVIETADGSAHKLFDIDLAVVSKQNTAVTTDLTAM